MNIFGRKLSVCSRSPLTGWKRNGYCDLDELDHGTHTICTVVTEDFLQFTLGRGNDLISPRGGFAGLKPGDKWCVCALRWKEAYENGYAPPVIGEATHIGSFNFVPKQVLMKYVIDV